MIPSQDRFQNLLRRKSSEKKAIFFQKRVLQSTPIHFEKRYLDKLLPKGSFIKKAIAITSVIGLVLFAHIFQNSQQFLSTSVFDSISFSGMVDPIEKVPNWAILSDRERNMSYDELSNSKLISLPKYDLTAMKAGSNYDRASDYQKNVFITYPVPYMGNYMLDGTEYSGSHPGIDIKVPLQTPIRAIANGIIHKSENSSFGFGNYITILHPNVPDDRGNETRTIYSSYAHLSNRSVREGDRVEKGQIIGYSGQSGDATAPHLHFQIDTEDAPFVPYWPFTWNDVQQAGYRSYFDGVRYGVGKNKVQQYGIHPVNLLAQFESYESHNLVVSIDPVIVDTLPQETDNEEEKEQETSVKENATTPSTDTKPTTPDQSESNDDYLESADTSDNHDRFPIEIAPAQDNVVIEKTLSVGKYDIVFEDIKSFVPEEKQQIRLLINEKNLIASATDMIYIDTTLKGLAEVEPQKLTQNDFKDGIAEISFKTYSDSTFKLIAKGNFGEVKSNTLRAQVFSDVAPNYDYASAIKELKAKNILNGYPDGTFRPEATLNRAESIKILIAGNMINLKANAHNTFTDVPDNEWFANYVKTAYQLKIVKGYPDGSFRPQNTVSRAEFLKMALLTAGFDMPESATQNPYTDVDKGDWFAVYFEFAKDNDIIKVQTANRIFPNQALTRGEAADIIYKISQLK